MRAMTLRRDVVETSTLPRASRRHRQRMRQARESALYVDAAPGQSQQTPCTPGAWVIRPCVESSRGRSRRARNISHGSFQQELSVKRRGWETESTRLSAKEERNDANGYWS